MTSFTLNKEKKYLAIYLVVTLVCVIFSYVYEIFSHGVYSNHLIYAFAIPLVLGVVPQLFFVMKPELNVGSSWQKIIHNFAIATLTTGSILKGILEIYGTTSPFIMYYFIIGFWLLALSALYWIVNFKNKPTKKKK